MITGIRGGTNGGHWIHHILRVYNTLVGWSREKKEQGEGETKGFNKKD